MSLHKFTVQEAQNAALGQAGYVLLSDSNTGTAAAGVEYIALTILDQSDVLVSTTSFDSNKYPDLSTVPVPAGTTIFGRWSQVTIASAGGTGKAIAYRG
mgnify:CR=1 FL=1